MNQKKYDKFVAFVTTLGAIGLIIENYVMGWEFWVPPVIFFAFISLWASNLSERIPYEIKINVLFGSATLLVFYHGVHDTSLFDASLAVVLAMTLFSFFNIYYMMNVLMIEYLSLMIIHTAHLSGVSHIDYNRLTISRLFLHIFIVLLVYYINLRTIRIRREALEEDDSKNQRIKVYEKDMEDFLTNISHELRTPVNVVNGISDILIKHNVGNGAEEIKKAGLKLAYQIEDIQDYTECKRDTVLLENENYMTMSLVNEVVSGFRLLDNSKKLDFIVDLDPMTPHTLHGDYKKLQKVLRHLLENAVKFTHKGGILLRLYGENTAKGFNLCIEMSDTGIGMDKSAAECAGGGMYQADKERTREAGGIGLGLFIVYGFVHKMNGSVVIDSEKNEGTTVRVTLPQEVVKESPSIELTSALEGDIIFHVRLDKYDNPKVRDYYRTMASNLISGIGANMYSAESIDDVDRLMNKLNIRYIFMGKEEYEENYTYFDRLSKDNTVVAVSAPQGFKTSENSRVLVMPKPLYAYPVIKILDEGQDVKGIEYNVNRDKPSFEGVRALVVDDEQMNLQVALELFKEYKMHVDTCLSGAEAIRKYYDNDYDVIFMDHMMPEMDGVETMKKMKELASRYDKQCAFVALTANAVSGAKEMFIREGFDGFISKPIFTPEFERVLLRVLGGNKLTGGDSL